ncbi:MAG: hypothetical protein KA239_10810 [Bacteroidia bacterium]|nr:hypothetical protein [Bacteroidia bacterium]
MRNLRWDELIPSVATKLIRGNQQVSKRELEEIVGIGSTAIDNNLAYLRDLGLLKRIGTKGGRWMIRYIEP